MSLYSYGGKLVFANGIIYAGQNCCCGGGGSTACSDASPCLSLPAKCIASVVVTNNAACGSALAGIPNGTTLTYPAVTGVNSASATWRVGPVTDQQSYDTQFNDNLECTGGLWQNTFNFYRNDIGVTNDVQTVSVVCSGSGMSCTVSGTLYCGGVACATYTVTWTAPG